MEFEIFGGLVYLSVDRGLGGRLHAQRPEPVAAQSVFPAQALEVDRYELSAHGPPLDTDVVAGADHGEAGEPQAIDGLASECTEVLRDALGISERAALQHADDLIASGQQNVQAF